MFFRVLPCSKPNRCPTTAATTGATAATAGSSVVASVWPFDLAWNPSTIDASVAPTLFAASLLPYLGFLYFLHSSKKTPGLTLFGFYFLLAFVGATIPAGIYAKSHYGTSLANVDWLHGCAESLLTVTNLLIVLGFRQGIREAEAAKAGGEQLQQDASKSDATSKQEKEVAR